jgi:predicted RNA-binding protein with TRAM domain
MTAPDLHCLFTGRIEEQNGDYMIEIPASELDLNTLSVGEVYRVGVYPAADGSAEGISRPDPTNPMSADPTVQEDDGGPPVEEGEVLELTVKDVGDQGDGLARVGPGYVVFVPDARVGDEPTVRITTVRENFAFAERVE